MYCTDSVLLIVNSLQCKNFIRRTEPSVIFSTQHWLWQFLNMHSYAISCVLVFSLINHHNPSKFNSDTQEWTFFLRLLWCRWWKWLYHELGLWELDRTVVLWRVQEWRHTQLWALSQSGRHLQRNWCGEVSFNRCLVWYYPLSSLAHSLKAQPSPSHLSCLSYSFNYSIFVESFLFHALR